MARNKNTETETVTEEVKELSPEAIAAREAVASRPRQSVARFVEYFMIVRDTAPDELERLFGDQIPALEEAAASGRVENPIQKAIETATTAQKERAFKALENTDALNGYADFVFDAEVFEAKTAPKKERVRKTVAEKAEDLLSSASEADLKALAEMLAARGIS
ncbi:hypothetical protein SEA_CRUNCHYBOI_28 [Microbacterium phage CrunchyBoi]|nr:hypothetical protein SEA_CRUNCHYBOI_28 [Microbacterium phage CrunchyBoi]